MAQFPDVLAAGAVVSRSGREVLLVHRPRYDDWSFPKGKLDRGEHPTSAAVREVEEETGLRVRLGPALAPQRYPHGSRMKSVYYWAARVAGDDDVSGYLVNEEIDEVGWFRRDDAALLLTYDHDRFTLEESFPLRRASRPIVVLRHAEARARKSWRRDDPLRPLLAEGTRQAARIAPVLAAYDVARVVTSTSVRCAATVAPYADLTGWPVEELRFLSEEQATARSVAGLLDELVHGRESTVICTHRPVLPTVFDMLGVDDPGLEPGGMVVVHLRKGTVLGTETHLIA